MKRILSVFLMLTLVLGLCACSSKEEKETDVNETETNNVSEPSSDYGTMPEFSVVDIEGNTVTDDIFSQAELTVVNFWATYCNPCINELPDLGMWSESMDENLQIIGVLVDVKSLDSDEYTNAQTIVEETGAHYPHLVADEQFDDIISQIVGVPTTFFVDRDGNIVGEPILGADVDGYKLFVKEYFNEK